MSTAHAEPWGDAPVGKLRRLAWERHCRDLETGGQRGLWFDEEAADRVVTFFESFLRHEKGEWAGQPLLLEPWQREEVLRPLFGWKRADGTRRYRFGYVEIPRKNGKSTVGGGVGDYLLIADGERGAEVYSAATKRDQAKIVFNAAAGMIRQSPELSRFATVLRNNISVEETASKFEPVSSESSTLDGLNASGVIIDELHAHRDRGVYDVLVTSMGAREQPLVFIITTAGVYNPESIGWELHDYAVKVLEGSIDDDAWFAFIAAADDEDDWRDPVTWRKANPNYGVSVKPSYMEEAAKAAEARPAATNTFLRLHLNRWTQQAQRWLSVEKWNACDGPVDVASLAGRPCFAGLDLAQKLDIAGTVLAFPEPDGGGYTLLPRFYVPEEVVLEREQKGSRPSYAAWVRDGHLLTTPGNVIDYDFIRRDINEQGKLYDIREIAFDPWAAMQVSLQLAGDGFTMVQMRQGFLSLSEPSKEFERLIVSGKIRHGGHPVLRWMVSNVQTTEDAAGNIKPDKGKSTEKIDGVVASIMAIGRAMLQPTPKGSVYKRRGLSVL